MQRILNGSSDVLVGMVGHGLFLLRKTFHYPENYTKSARQEEKTRSGNIAKAKHTIDWARTGGVGAAGASDREGAGRVRRRDGVGGGGQRARVPPVRTDARGNRPGRSGEVKA